MFNHKPDKTLKAFQFENLSQGTAFTTTIKSVCVFEGLKTMSEEKTLTFCTLPEAPTNLVLDSRFPNSLTVKWDTPTVTQLLHKNKMTIEAPSIGYSNEYTTSGDKNTFNFSKLPDIVGTGEEYVIKIEYLVTPAGSDIEVASAPLIGSFMTKPLPPTNFKLGMESNEITWLKSSTPNVR